jgi:hypothetical protein
MQRKPKVFVTGCIPVAGVGIVGEARWLRAERGGFYERAMRGVAKQASQALQNRKPSAIVVS